MQRVEAANTNWNMPSSAQKALRWRFNKASARINREKSVEEAARGNKFDPGVDVKRAESKRLVISDPKRSSTLSFVCFHSMLFPFAASLMKYLNFHSTVQRLCMK